MWDGQQENRFRNNDDDESGKNNSSKALFLTGF
jgi:hypothetical protein